MKDHFIPCLLLSQFSIDGRSGRKAKVYQLRTDGPHPNLPVAVKDLAHAGDFYSHSEFPDLDAAGLRAKETQASSLIRELLNGADPQVHSAAIASLMDIQAARTKSFRTHSSNRVTTLIDKAVVGFATPAGLEHVGRILDKELPRGDVDSLVRLDVPRPVAEAAVAKLGEAGVRRLVCEHLDLSNLKEATDIFEAASSGNDVAGRGIAKAQVSAMHEMVQENQVKSSLSAARFIRLEATEEPLILGDCCVVCVGSDGSIGWPFKFGPEWSEVYLPVGKNLAVVAVSSDGPNVPSLDVATLNRASAELSREYLYASQCTPLERSLAARIGSAEPLMNDADIDSLVTETLQEKSEPVQASKKVGRNAPCPCDSGKKFKKCCWKQ